LKPSGEDKYLEYYSADQITELNQILALCDLGLSPSQIEDLLNEELTSNKIKTMIRMRRMEPLRFLEEKNIRLGRAEARLSIIEKDYESTFDQIIIKDANPLTVAAIREKLPERSSILIAQLFDEIFIYLDKHNIRPAGNSQVIYYDSDYSEKEIEVEVVVPIDRQIAGKGRILIKEIPEDEFMACITHKDNSDYTFLSYYSLMFWIEKKGYCIAGPIREIYLNEEIEGMKNSDFWIEICVPIREAI